MKLNDKLSVRCSDGITRTGTIIYIHPDKIFITLEFEGTAGKFREAILLDRSKRKKSNQVRWQPYTKEEDKLILNSDDDSRLARQLHRTKCAIQNRRARLKQCIIPNT